MFNPVAISPIDGAPYYPVRDGFIIAPRIDGRAVWAGDSRECARLYRQFQVYFRGNFGAIRAYYCWTRLAMIIALRHGRPSK